ncbi:MAG TPA: sugar transferase [Nocardioidaceae bacterium]|nr:sugar transferase [Nocardioidaceae bacterium]
MTGQIFDRAVALVSLLVLSPLLALIAVAVRLTSPGPVLFRQVRIGLRGRPFEILKFRTMVDGADRLAANVSPEGDPRVTPVGRFLRDWYLDELPQFFNVLKGDMSLVGPRPETPEYVALYTPAERRVLEVRPGIAGPSTLAHMDEAERLASVDDPAEHYKKVLLHERVQMDIGYLEKKSLLYDVGLLLRQVVAIARH